MAFVLPPFQVPDEASHFFKAYSIFFNKDVTINDSYRTGKAVLNLPKNIGAIIDKYNMDLFNSGYTITAKEFFADSSVKFNNQDKKESFFFGNTIDLPNFCYIPVAIIIFICIKLNLPFIFMPLFARIINLLIFSIAGYLSIKMLPRFKKMFMAIMLMPITIQQAVGINQDSITNSLFFLVAAILITMIFSKEKIKNYKCYILIVLSALLGFCKTGYFAILFLALFIPKNKFENKKLSFVFKCLIIIPCLFLSFAKYLDVAIVTSNANVSYYSINTLFTNPLLIANVCLNTIMNRFHLDMLTGLIDGFAWSTVWHKPLIQFIVTIIYFLIILTAVDKEEKMKIKHRIIFLISAIIIFGMIYASLLFGWTNYGATMIDGLQCRYFIPVTLLFYLSISNNCIKLNFKNNDFAYVLGIIAVNMLSFCTIIRSFYI